MVGRITHMETCMERLQAAVLRGQMDKAAYRAFRTLCAYLESGQWRHDYEADERGEIPQELRRGVLSQDALYDLLREAKLLKERG